MLGFDIRWRGKRIDGNGEWLIGSLYDDGGELYILPPFPGSALDYENYQINPNTLGLWIGRIDKYKRTIFTGDLLRDEKGKVWKVGMERDQVQVAMKSEDGILKLLPGFKFEECEVIGTLYD